MKLESQFTGVIGLIKNARLNTFSAINRELINLYWEIGKYICQRTKAEGWGKSTVLQLADYIQKQEPDLKGFSDKNLWRMKQFYETYCHYPKLATLWREISWSHNRMIMSLKTIEEQEFYLQLCVNERYSVRELERQINSSYFERIMIGNSKLSAQPRVLNSNIENIFKDTYVLEFLNLPVQHNENQLQNAIVANLKNFILEFGRDFAFMGQEYRIQVGNQDFFIDLLFYHRTLQCLVAIELKTERFAPEHLAQINFYLEALDRDVKNEKENPSIGILLCKGKDDVVVEYALSRALNPAMVADYQLALPNKKLLHDKWQEILEMNEKELGEI